MSKTSKRAERELNATASMELRRLEKAKRPNLKKISQAMRIRQWKEDLAVQAGLAEAGIEPTRGIDEYHLRIAHRGTTISAPTGADHE